MKRKLSTFFIQGLTSLVVVLCISFSSYTTKTDTISPINQLYSDTVLQNLPDIDIDYISAIQNPRHLLPINSWFFKNIGEIPCFSESVTGSFINSQFNIQTMFHYSFQMLSSSAGGFGPPLPGTSQTKHVINDEDDIARYFKTPGVELTQVKQWNMLPFNFRKGIVEMLYSMNEAKTVFDQFSKPVKESLAEKSLVGTVKIYEELIIPWEKRELKEFGPIELIEKADIKKLSFANRILMEKLNWFFMQKELAIPKDFTRCSINSDLGELLISGTGNDTIKGEHFFVVELGGDDVYLGNTASPVSFEQPFGLVADLKGNDKYLCDNNFLVAGILGIAVLIDLNGDDLYQTNRPGLAFSLYGSSLLYDNSGNDVYIGNSKYVQAATFFGASLLVDISGDDRYNSKSSSQAFGGTLGVGMFFDYMGDDHYNTNKTTGIDTQNLPSFVQGASKGRWAEATDGQSLAGGIGVFIDSSGIDIYAANSFSQGASYYFGLGLFNDSEGDDLYDAISHSQGYAAHCSLACFNDKSGNDTYNAESNKDRITQMIGSGRDYSAGLFIDHLGNDSYHFGNRSTGIGDSNGIGFFADLKGDDNYYWHKNKFNHSSPSLGKKVSLNQGMDIGFKVFKPSVNVSEGIFIDIDGNNSFKDL